MAKKRSASAATPAVAALLQAQVPHTVHEYVLTENSDKTAGSTNLSFGEAVAAAVGVDPGRMYKTLVALVDTTPYCAVVPVEAQLDLKALAAAVGGKKAQLASTDEATRLTGYVPGGISPFGLRKNLHTIIDEGALAWPTVFVSGGKRGLSIEIPPQDLVRETRAQLSRLASA